MFYRSILFSLFSIFMIVFMTGCSSGSNESSQLNYKDMKSMVIDILKTEDAQKALQESAAQTSGYTAQSSSMLTAQDQEQIRLAVKDVMSSPDYDKVIKKLMTDTRFAGEFSKAVNENNKDIHKELIKDPQYQKELVTAFESDEMQKLILKVIKTPDYRKELTSLMQDSLKNPIFRLEMLDLMRKAVSEELAVKSESDSGSQGGQGSSGSSDNGGDSGSNSGGGGGS